MTQVRSTDIAEYDVWQQDGRWYAKRRPRITQEQREHGIREELSAETWNDLFIACMAQRCRASWYG